MTEATPSAHVGRRLAGIGIDWVLCLAVSSALFADPALLAQQPSGLERVLLTGAPFTALGVWAVQHLLLVASIGTTIGHRLLGLRVVREDGPGPVGVAKAALRTVLLGLVIPAVVWGPDGRGLHDRAAGTRIVRVR